MTDRPALVFDGVHKSYGRSKALSGLSFSIPRGSICGFVGPNGAGKTTTFSVVSGFLAPDAGTLDILGLPAFDPWALKGRLGVLPQDAELSDRHTPRELLVHLGRLQGLAARAARTEAERVLALVRLGDRSDSRIASLSHGMRRRVAVGSALLGSPELVLLDEPMAGLDPLQAKSLREALTAVRGLQTLVVSSHNLDELERFCDYVVMIDKGRTLREGTVHEVTGQSALVEWDVVGAPSLEALHAALPGHTFAMVDGVMTQSAPEGADLDASSIVVVRVLGESGVGLREVRRGVGLERRFLSDALAESADVP
ncbi:MAG: ABC transporter ATP-binding protein [Myxococcota bacterium]